MNKVYDQIRYSNCWEDADLLLKGLDVQSGARILSVGSGGDNSFSLLTRDPSLVHIVDVNPHQIALIKLKVSAFKVLNYEKFMEFLGFSPCPERIELYNLLSTELDDVTKGYWDERLEIISGGIVYAGKFDRYLRLFSQKIVPLIHSKKKRAQLFEDKSAAEQKEFYQKKWNTFLWRSFFKLFFSRRFMALAGRHPSFFEHVTEPVSQTILNRTAAHFSSVECQENYFLYYILFGSFGTRLPHYARKTNFERIKRNLDRIKISQVTVEDLSTDESGYDCFNLSNIFEYQDTFTFQHTAHKLKTLSNPNARFAYWNLLVTRTLHTTDSSRFKLILDRNSEELNDNGFFYSNFYVSEAV